MLHLILSCKLIVSSFYRLTMLASLGYVVKITVDQDASGAKITEALRDAFDDAKSGVKEFGEAEAAYWADKKVYLEESYPWRLLSVCDAGKGKTSYLVPRAPSREVDTDILMQYVRISGLL